MPSFKTMPLVALDYAVADLAEGEFRARVAVFGNRDDQNDRVVRGAFNGTLARWAERGDPIPVVWSHQWADPFAYIGQVLDAAETNEGLEVHGALDLDNATAEQVHRLMLKRRVRQWSFAYDTLDNRLAEDGANELVEVELYEVGPALVGANQLTDLLAAKAVNATDTTDVSAVDYSGRARSLALRAKVIGSGVALAAKAPVAPHSTATTDVAWDGPANEARVRSGETADYYRRIYAWRDPDADETTKAGWRFIHHMIGGDGSPGPANVRACSTAIAVLNGGRGGTTIPSADRAGVWAHLAKHLRDADLEPPPLR